MELVLLSLGLGLAGFDVLGALVVLAATSRGVGRRQVALFAVVTFAATVAVGVALALLVGDGIGAGLTGLLDLPDAVWVVLESVAVVLLLRWAVLRWRRRDDPQQRGGTRIDRLLRRGLLAVGLLFAALAPTDPSFLALVAFASRDGDAASIVVANAVWIAVSQAPLFVLATAVVLGADKRISAWFERLRVRFGRTAATALTLVVALAGVLLLADLVVLAVTGDWLYE